VTPITISIALPNASSATCSGSTSAAYSAPPSTPTSAPAIE
jgi:hypothetical protein